MEHIQNLLEEIFQSVLLTFTLIYLVFSLWGCGLCVKQDEIDILPAANVSYTSYDVTSNQAELMKRRIPLNQELLFFVGRRILQKGQGMASHNAYTIGTAIKKQLNCY